MTILITLTCSAAQHSDSSSTRQLYHWGFGIRIEFLQTLLAFLSLECVS